MSTISVTNINDGDAVTAASVNNQVNTIVNDYNGNITSANLASNAVTDAKITANNLLASKFSNPYKFRVYLTSAQNTSAAAFTRLLCDTRTFDTSSNVDITSTKGRFTAPIAGFYNFSGAATCNLNGTGTFGMALYKNAAIHSLGNLLATTAYSNTGNVTWTVNDTIQLAANDTVDLMVFCSAAVAIVTGSSNSWFSGFMVSSI